MNEKKQEFQLELTPEIARGTYANLAIIAHSPSEFVIDFARIVPGFSKVPVMSRVILAPEHAKRLLFALEDNLRKYEAQFGPVQLTTKNPEVPPFMPTGGEA